MSRAICIPSYLYLLSCRNNIFKRSEGLLPDNVEKWETKTIQYTGKIIGREMSQHYHLEKIKMLYINCFTFLIKMKFLWQNEEGETELCCFQSTQSLLMSQRLLVVVQVCGTFKLTSKVVLRKPKTVTGCQIKNNF